MPGLFVTGTGTGVGKTFVTACLIRAARRAGVAVDAVKPVLSGYDAADAAPSDAGVLLSALERPLTAASIAALAPWRYAAPLSPNMAAAAEGRRIDIPALTAFCRAAVSHDRLTLIEGVGGVMVPLDDRSTVLDLIAALALPVLLVTGSELGAISHCLTAVTALGTRQIAPLAVVLNETAASTVPLDATAETLRGFCREIPVVTLPQSPSARHFDALLARVAR